MVTGGEHGTGTRDFGVTVSRLISVIYSCLYQRFAYDRCLVGLRF